MLNILYGEFGSFGIFELLYTNLPLYASTDRIIKSLGYLDELKKEYEAPSPISKNWPENDRGGKQKKRLTLTINMDDQLEDETDDRKFSGYAAISTRPMNTANTADQKNAGTNRLSKWAWPWTKMGSRRAMQAPAANCFVGWG